MKTKKLSSVLVGKINEGRTEKLLQANGFKVHTVKLNARYGKQDIFELHDHVAKLEYIDDILILVQTKTNRNARTEQYERMADFNYKYQFVFVWYDDKEDPDIFKEEHLIIDNKIVTAKKSVKMIIPQILAAGRSNHGFTQASTITNSIRQTSDV